MKTYKGSCHCGNVTFEAQIDLKEVMSCNCSICSRVGSLLTFIPPEQFKLLSGQDADTEYLWGKKRIHRFFCKTCGIHTYARGKDQQGKENRAINVRSLEGVDLDSLKVRKFDGKSL